MSHQANIISGTYFSFEWKHLQDVRGWTGKGTSSTRAARAVPQNCGFSRWGPQVKLESRESAAITVFGGSGHEFSCHGVLMNIIPMMNEILSIPNPVIGESALPHFGAPPANGAERMGVSALDELDGALYRYILSRSEQEMCMIGHKDERVQCVATFSTVVIKSLEE